MAPSTRRRTALCVPASSPEKVAKALASPADEVVVDLEDAVAIDAKDTARITVGGLRSRERGLVAVRVNAPGTAWHRDDLVACVMNPAVDSIVIPKVESPEQVQLVVDELTTCESAHGRVTPLAIQALIESPRALQNVGAIADGSDRLVSLIIGYADLAASLGRRVDATWQFARDAVLLAARCADIQAIDGPHLSVADDEDFAAAVQTAAAQGFDGKWAIHPRQIATIAAALTPSAAETADARELIAVMEQAQRDGAGAIAWRGRMLDEALVLSARRTLRKAGD